MRGISRISDTAERAWGFFTVQSARLLTKLSLHALSACFLLVALGCAVASLSACDGSEPPGEPPGGEPPADTLASVPTPLADSCLSHPDNATLVANAENTISRLAPSDTVAAMTKRGTCAGYGVWSEEGVTFAVAGGPVPGSTASSREWVGYHEGDQIQLVVRDGETGDADSLYHQWSACTEDDLEICGAGDYAPGSIHDLTVLGEPPGNGEVFACAMNDSTAHIDVPSESLATTGQEGVGWKRRSDTTAEGGSYIGALPNDGANVPADSAGDFSIPIRAHFCRAGTWQVRLRAAHSGGGGSDDSFRLVSEDTTHTFNNLEAPEGRLGAVPAETWVPITDMGWGNLKIGVEETGIQTMRLRIREDGLRIDHLQLVHTP
jgi:hypothetical protein